MIDFTRFAVGPFTINYWLYFIVLSGQSDVYNYSAATGIFFTLLTIPLVVAGRFFMIKLDKYLFRREMVRLVEQSHASDAAPDRPRPVQPVRQQL